MWTCIVIIFVLDLRVRSMWTIEISVSLWEIVCDFNKHKRLIKSPFFSLLSICLHIHIDLCISLVNNKTQDEKKSIRSHICVSLNSYLTSNSLNDHVIVYKYKQTKWDRHNFWICLKGVRRDVINDMNITWIMMTDSKPLFLL